MIIWKPEIVPPDRALVAWAEAQHLPYLCRLLRLWHHYPGKVVYAPAAQPERAWLREVGAGAPPEVSAADATAARLLALYVGGRLSERPIANPCGEIALDPPAVDVAREVVSD